MRLEELYFQHAFQNTNWLVMKLSKLFAGSSPKKNIFHMAQHDHMFHLWKSNNQNSKWASKTTAYIARTPLVFAPFLPYPSCHSLPSAFQAVFPGTPYFLTLSCKTCNNWQAPHLEKRVTKSMISYTTMLWYTNMQISFHTHCSRLLAGCITFKI